MNSPRMRVCLIGPQPPPSGGMANQTLQLAELLRAENIDVVMVQTNAPYQPAWIGRVRVLRALFRLLPYIVRLWRQLADAHIAHLMANSGWSWYLYSVPAAVVARLRHVPFIVNYRGGEAESFFAHNAWAVRRVVRSASAAIVPSGFLRDVFASFGMQASVVPNIVDLKRFAPREATSADGPHLLITRNLEPIYDLPTALRAFAAVRAELPDARLTMAGEGPQLDTLRALAMELGVADAVRFTGRIANDSIAALYAAAHISVNPSLADNMPISILESLASGVPVVSTNVGGVPYLVEHGKSALLVTPGDHAAMAAAVLRLWRDRALAARLRAAGLEVARRFDWASVRPQLFAVYAQAVGRAEWARADT